MHKDFLFLFLYTASIFLSGFSFLLLFFKEVMKKQNVFINTALSWLLGSSFFILILYVLSFFNQLTLITSDSFIIVFLLIFLTTIFLSVRRYKDITPMSWKNWLFIIILIVFFIPLIKDSLFSYLIGWDALAIWMLKAKVFFYQSGFWNNSFFTDTSVFSYANKPYPLGIPLLIAGYYRLIGSVNDQASQFILLMFYLNMVFLFYGTVRKFFAQFSHLMILLITLSLTLLPNFIIYAHNGYVDMAMGFIILAGTVIFIDFLAEKEHHLKLNYAALLIIIGALASTIKNEGYTFWAMILGSIIASFFMNRKTDKISFKQIGYLGGLFLLTLLPVFLWEYVKKTYHAPTSYYFVNAGLQLHSLARLKPIIFQYLDEIINVTKYSILLMSFFFLFIIQSTILVVKKKITHLLPSLFIITQLIFYSAIFLIASVPIDWQVKALDRLLLHLLPSFFIVVLYLIKPVEKYIKEYYKTI